MCLYTIDKLIFLQTATDRLRILIEMGSCQNDWHLISLDGINGANVSNYSKIYLRGIYYFGKIFLGSCAALDKNDLGIAYQIFYLIYFIAYL